MRFSTVMLGLFSVGLVGAASLVGCGSESGNTGGNGTGGGGNTTTSTGTGTDTTSGGFPCSPGASCKAADKECIGLVDNTGKTSFGLRMSQLDVTAPAALTTGLVGMVVGGAVKPSDLSCNLDGSATFNWLLQFDTTASTLKTGGAKPVTDPSAGYGFVDEMVTQAGKTFHIQPVTFSGVKPDASGNFSVTMGTDLLVPIYLDNTGTSVVILPLKNARLSMGTVSASQNCIGHYNAEGLDVTNSCLGDATHPTFITAAQLDGIITLEDADTVIIDKLGTSLCALLSGNPTMYGEKNADGITVCKRTGGVINFQGDTCSMAGQTCKDSVVLGAKFAASSVKIN